MILLVITTLASIISVWLIPKRISIMEMYTTSFFALFLATMSELFLDIKLELYGFFETGVDWEYILIYIFIYPAVNILFLNFYPFQKLLLNKAGYVLLWTILTTLFEYLSLQTEVYYYKEWKLEYSMMCYPFIYVVLILNLNLIRKLSPRSKYGDA